MRPMRGIGLKVVSVVIFIVMASLIKAVEGRVPAGEVVFFRSFFALPVILIWLTLRREMPAGLRTQNPLGHIWRGFAGTTAMGLGFAGLALLPLPEVTAIGYAAPLLTVVFAAMFLGEQVRAFRLIAVVVGLAGVLIVLSPRLGAFGGESDAEGLRATLGAIVVLGGAVFNALAQVFVRKLVATERTATIVFYFSLTASGLALVTLPFGWVVPEAGDAALLILAGLLGGVGQIFLTASYREADASVVAPFEYVSILFALAIGFAIFGEVPTPTMLAGAGIVIAAGIAIIWRERQLGLERARQRQAMTPQG
ncbi:MAG: DMT family transporter [Alphaproteobacteria bacterium]|nr:DMT family transporter [Alphaproteobacteria bacterium]